MAAAVLAPARPLPPRMDLDDDDFDVGGDIDHAITQIDEKAIERNDSTEPMAMLAFYKRILPFKSLYTWLNRDLPHQPTKNFTHREFAFTLTNDVYIRYNSFADWEEFKREVVRLNPARFEIGPVYTAKPKDRKTVQKSVFRPVSRELVFDIDMTDYDSIRTCCSGKGICKRCWSFIAVAVEVLDEALRSDFGFKHLLWVYSGRRGIHLWISDKDACEMADEARRAIVGWLEVVKGGSQQKKKVDAGKTLHPALRRAVGGEGGNGPLTVAFVETVLRDQDCFRQREQWELLLSLLPSTESEALGRLRNKWESHPSRNSQDKWEDILAEAKKSKAAWKPAMEEIILQYTYPRIDAEVSKHRNHLLKSPFVVHPATGRVCVPLDAKSVATFDPEEDCPTVALLLRELNEWERKNGRGGVKMEDDEGKTSAVVTKGDWEKTSLKKYVDLLDRHCAAITKEARDAKRVMQSHSMDF
ncbi:prim-pol domain-containing protein [Microstroma glucosiphilum]|uniref:DNA primase n=1 Tax=Pseudomicrostroma glucosiphilum TaxID=1684307 RepID=A0A316UJK9_9BASI|nr:prim-pol domain-containing protein [Pseudomicrostroma glucosiphilum]PWN23405.1 prim-pol domain-containing protein [Pseudomicrostroma glucosiphilum]